MKPILPFATAVFAMIAAQGCEDLQHSPTASSALEAEVTITEPSPPAGGSEWKTLYRKHRQNAAGNGTPTWHADYLATLSELKEHPDTVANLVALFNEEPSAGERWFIAQVLADLDTCEGLNPLFSIASRNHAELGEADCDHCEMPNSVEVLITSRAIVGLERLLAKSCANEAEDALAAVAVESQSEAGRFAAVATLKLVAGWSVSDLEALGSEIRTDISAIREFDYESDQPPAPTGLAPDGVHSPEFLEQP